MINYEVVDLTTPIGIMAAAYYLPPTRKSVSAIFDDESIPAEPLAANVDFRRDIGIEAVHLAGEASAASLGLHACQQALAEAQLDPGEIDLILDFTSVPEEYVAPTWSAAGWIQHQLGANRALATAINTGGCASYHSALKAACAWMRANPHLQTALLFAGDKVPPLNHTYYPITVICDGGSAVILRRGWERRVILAVELASVGKLHDVWYIPGFAYHNPDDLDDDRWLHMTADVAKFNAEVIPINLFMFRRVMRQALKRAGLKQEEIAHYIYPTFSTWDQRSFCQGLRLPPEKVYRDGLGRHGHLQETDMVLNYVDAEREGRIQPGDLVMVTGNGAGFAWGAAVIRA